MCLLKIVLNSLPGISNSLSSHFVCDSENFALISYKISNICTFPLNRAKTSLRGRLNQLINKFVAEELLSQW